MKKESELQRKERFDEYIKNFIESGIITSDKTIDYNKFIFWFTNYVKTSSKKTIPLLIDAIEDANYISKCACEELNVKYDDNLLDGGLKDDQLARFILSIVPKDEAIKEIKEIVSNIKEDKKESNEIIKQIEIDDEKQEIKEDEKIVKICLLLKPILATIENENSKDIVNNNIIINLQTECLEILERNGYSKKQIDDALEIVCNSKIEPEKHKDKKEEYNAYNDWRYIYYMSTLGAGYGIYYNKNEGLISIIYRSLKKEENAKDIEEVKQVHSSSKEKERKIEDKSKYEKEFYQQVIEFKRKYCVDLDSKYLLESFSKCSSALLYKENYKEELSNVYKTSSLQSIDTAEFVKDFDKMASVMNKFIGLKYARDFGGMSGDEVYKFCIDLCDQNFNISAKIEKELFSKYGRIDKIDSSLLTSIIEQKFTETYNSLDLEDSDAKREALAYYLVLDKTNKERTRFFRIAHPFKYSKEVRVLSNMKKVIEDGIEDNDIGHEVNDMMRKKTVYKQGFEEQKTRLRTFSLAVGKSFLLNNETRTIEVDLGDDDFVNIERKDAQMVEEEQSKIMTNEDEMNVNI